LLQVAIDILFFVVEEVWVSPCLWVASSRN